MDIDSLREESEPVLTYPGGLVQKSTQSVDIEHLSMKTFLLSPDTQLKVLGGILKR